MHCHLLPGVDDGPGTMDESVDMARAALEAGVETVIATTHALNAGSVPDRHHLENLAKQVQDKTGLRVLVGYELHILALAEGLNPKGFTLDQSEFVLVELSMINKMQGAKDYLFDMLKKGLRPVLAHPERYHYADSDCLRELREVGVMIQVNTRSFAGDYGRAVAKKAWNLIKQGLVDFLASDAHQARHYETHRAVMKELADKHVPVHLMQPGSITKVFEGEQT